MPAGASAGSSPRDVVLYSIGITTDPYGRSHPRGFGLATGILSGNLGRTEVRRREYAWFPGADWFGDRILVSRRGAVPRTAALFSYRGGRLVRSGLAPFPGGSVYFWSPSRAWIAYGPPSPCPARTGTCYRTGLETYLVRPDGSDRRLVARGVLGGWTRDGRLVFYPTRRAWARGDATILDLRTHVRRQRQHYWPDQQPIRSADLHYFAGLRGFKEGYRLAIVSADGHLVQAITTHYIVSMLAWSTRGHLLAYTTSGFPAPHQLFVVDPGHEPRKIFATGAKHFDWITWSPDGRHILLDGAEYGGWHVFSARSGRQVRGLPRLGGRPQWCCPVNPFRRNA